MRHALDDLHQRMRSMFVANLRAQVEGADAPHAEGDIDALLNQCAHECCQQCGDIFCEFGEALHFHHDGCPCCAMIDDEQWVAGADARRLALIERNREQ